MLHITRTLLALVALQLTACAVIDDLTTGNWTNWGCDPKTQNCDNLRADTQKSWAKANNVPEDHSWSKDAASKLTAQALVLTNAANAATSAGGGGMDTSSSCKGKGSCQFQMPTLSGCGTYASVSYPGHYGMEQTNTCSYDVHYKLVIKKGPNFDSYGGHDEFPRLKPGQKFRGNGMFFKSETTKVLENYSCRTREDVSRMLGMKVAGGPDPNRKGCTYITPSDEVGTSQ